MTNFAAKSVKNTDMGRFPSPAPFGLVPSALLEQVILVSFGIAGFCIHELGKQRQDIAA